MSEDDLSDEDVLLLSHEGATCVVTLNRPETLNSVTPVLQHRLTTLWREIAADPAVRAVVITGAGRAFSAGGDFEYLQANQIDARVRETSIAWDRTIQTEMLRFPLPVIAAVNGPAIGLGCSLAVGCDLVLLSDRAYLADPHVSVGLTAGDGGVTFWPLLTSLLRAKEYLLTGDRIPPQRAVDLGLANRVVPHEDLMPQALDLAERLGRQPAFAVRSTKAALNLVLEQLTRGGMEAALLAEREAMTSQDHIDIIEGLRAKTQRPS